MAKSLTEALNILKRGMRITQNDIDKLVELNSSCLDSEVYSFYDIWEGVSLIVNDPLYNGDAILPDNEGEEFSNLPDLPPLLKL